MGVGVGGGGGGEGGGRFIKFNEAKRERRSRICRASHPAKKNTAEVGRHGLINYIDIKAKCHHLKILPCKATLRQVFIRVYVLEIQSVMLVFLTKLCKVLPI